MSKYVVVSRNYRYAEVDCEVYEEKDLKDLIMKSLTRLKDTILHMYKTYPPDVKKYKRIKLATKGEVNLKKMIQVMLEIGNDLVRYEFGWGWYSVVRMPDGKQWL
jgi:hypothetical protein